MRRRFVSLVAVAVLLAALAAAPAAALGKKASTLQLRRTRLGTLLVNGPGFTLYTFSPDKRNRDMCASLPGCLSVWPAVTSGKPTAGPGVKKGLIGTIRVPHVGRQVTYAGHPLYTYVGDSRPGETANVNIFQSGGYWPAINAAGRIVR